MRLDKYLASAIGLGTRTEVKKIIRSGRVTVDGAAVCRPETSIVPGETEVAVDGIPTTYREYVYLMLNKPKGCVSATEDSRYPTVCDFVPAELKHLNLFPMGRLDIDTEGLVILTNDGALSHRLLSPKNHIPKTYIAELSRPLGENDIEAFKNGITTLDGFECAPAVLRGIGEKTAEVTIFEGKFHQVKRMFEAVQNEVVSLKRIRMNKLVLDESLKPGELRELTADELDKMVDDIKKYKNGDKHE